MSCLPSTRDVLLERHEGDASLGESVEDGDDLTPATGTSRESSRMARRWLRTSCCAVETRR